MNSKKSQTSEGNNSQEKTNPDPQPTGKKIQLCSDDIQGCPVSVN